MGFAARTTVTWRLRTRSVALGARTCVMGILNVTPDSFSDGGLFYQPEHEVDRALAQALAMLDAGADMLDVGGESTRPGSQALAPAEEQARVLPVIAAVLRARPGTILSIDTYHAETARLAVAAGAEIVNDVSGMLWDGRMAAACAELGCGVVAMHTRGRPQEWRSLPRLAQLAVAPLVVRELADRVEAIAAAGVERTRIAVDPGFGFGKILEENWPLLAGLGSLAGLGLPVVAGASRKRFLGRAVAERLGGEEPGVMDRVHATSAANVAAVLAGAHVLRVHDVAAAVEAAAVADAVLAAGTPSPLKKYLKYGGIRG
jgi:dihydropteroate synthase